MVAPLRIYRFDDSLTPTSIVESGRLISGEAFPPVHHPGKMLQIGDTFQITGSNNEFAYEDNAGTPNTVTLAKGGFSGDELIAEIAAKVLASAVPIPGIDTASSYSESSRLFTLASDPALTWEIHWNTGGGDCQRLADTMGFDNSADDTGFTAYVSDDAVYTKDYQYAVWQIDATDVGKSIEAIMVYATNLASDEYIRVFGADSNLGGVIGDWVAGGTYAGDAKDATKSRSNDLYVWLPGGVSMRYVAVFANRSMNANHATQEAFKMGCLGIWEDAGFDGADYADRTIRSQFETERVMLDSLSGADLGGNAEFYKRRGFRRITVGFGGWPEGAFHAIDNYLDKYRAEASLWLLDPDELRDMDKMVFGYVPFGKGYGVVRGRGPNHIRDFSITVDGLRMQAE